jgi:hypothetical protein
VGLGGFKTDRQRERSIDTQNKQAKEENSKGANKRKRKRKRKKERKKKGSPLTYLAVVGPTHIETEAKVITEPRISRAGVNNHQTPQMRRTCERSLQRNQLVDDHTVLAYVQMPQGLEPWEGFSHVQDSIAQDVFGEI